MKKLFILLFVLVCFGLTALENGEVILNASDILYSDYITEVTKVFYIENKEKNYYEFYIFYYEKIKKTNQSIKYYIDFNELKMSNKYINMNIIYKKQYKLLLRNIIGNFSGTVFMSEPIIIYSTEKNNYIKVKSFDDIKEIVI